MVRTGRPPLPQSRIRADPDIIWSAPVGISSEEYAPPNPTKLNLHGQWRGTHSDPIDLDFDEIIGGDVGNYFHTGLHPDSIVNDFHAESWTAEECLRYVLELFPDISHDFVLQCYSETAVHGPVDLAVITDSILKRTSYPKEKDAKAKNTTETDNDEVKGSGMSWQSASIDPNEAEIILRDEFNSIAVKHIKTVMCTEKNFLNAYLNLDDIQSSHGISARLKRRRSSSRAKTALSQLAEAELVAARVEAAKRRVQRRASEDVREAEERNERDAVANGLMTVCACCFTDVPCNRVAHCGGPEPHLFCFECARMNAETEIGQGRCRPKCMDQSGCKAQFADHQLRLCLGVQTLVRLNRLQQQQDLKEAGIEGLEECPFCNYMAVCLSTLVDREFRCGEPDCGKISCRLCHHETHIPLSCEMAAGIREKDNKIDARHVVEEAMTEALIRTCNNAKCKYRFVKIDGCNKMRCPQCGNTQCYICSETIEDYKHFTFGKCALHDDQGVEVRHREEVQKAEQAASAKIQAERPGINADDLSIKVSDAVKVAERNRAGNWAMTFPDQLFAGYVNELRGRNPVLAGANAQYFPERRNIAAMGIAPLRYDGLVPPQILPPRYQQLPPAREPGDPARLQESRVETEQLRAEAERRLRAYAERHHAKTKRLRADTGDQLHHPTQADYLARSDAGKAQTEHLLSRGPVGDFNQSGPYPPQPRQVAVRTQPRDLRLPMSPDHVLHKALNHKSTQHGNVDVGDWNHDLRDIGGLTRNQDHGHGLAPRGQASYQPPHVPGFFDPYLYQFNPYLDPLLKPLRYAGLLAEQPQATLQLPPNPPLDPIPRPPNPEMFPKGPFPRPANPHSNALPQVETPAQRRKRLDNLR